MNINCFTDPFCKMKGPVEECERLCVLNVRRPVDGGLKGVEDRVDGQRTKILTYKDRFIAARSGQRVKQLVVYTSS